MDFAAMMKQAQLVQQKLHEAQAKMSQRVGGGRGDNQGNHYRAQRNDQAGDQVGKLLGKGRCIRVKGNAVGNQRDRNLKDLLIRLQRIDNHPVGWKEEDDRNDQRDHCQQHGPERDRAPAPGSVLNGCL